MRICVTTFGSDGDVQPFIALASGLLAAGHDVELVGVDRFAAAARARRVPYRVVGQPWDLTRGAEEVDAVVRSRNPGHQAGLIVRMLEADMVATVPGLLEAVADVDLVVSHAFNVPGVAAARARNKPCVVAHLFSSVIRSSRVSPFGNSFGRFIDGALWSLAERITRKETDGPLNASVRAAGLAPWRDIMFRAVHSDRLNLVAISPSLLPEEPTWRGRYLVTGHWYLPAPDAPPDPDLAAFIEAGDERPVVVTFGSMMSRDARETTALLVNALAGLGRQVVLQAGWDELGGGALPAHVKRVGFVSHEWLFPRAALVVHHGGAGTTAAATRAGIPSLVVPHLGDQFFWGDTLHRRGVARAPLPRRSLTARRLAAAAKRALADEALAARAAELGRRVRGEDGVGTAVQAITALGGALR